MNSDASQMSPESSLSSLAQRMCAITVSRLYGSGGGEVAARLARRLGWALLDHEFVARIAQQLGMASEDIEAMDERSASFIERVLNNMDMGYPGLIGDASPSPAELSAAYEDALRTVVLAAADEGHVVIVGRGAFALLADRRDVLRALISAPLELRIAYVMRRERLDERAARERIRRKDGERQRHVATTFGVRPADPEHYDLCVNTGVLTLDDAVDLICEALERKARRLDAAEAELGPGAGQPPYPGPVADISRRQA